MLTIRSVSLICWISFLVTAGVSEEIAISGAVISRSRTGDEGEDGSGHVVNMNQLSNGYFTKPGSSGGAWMMFHLDDTYCVERIERFWKTEKTANIWTETGEGFRCEGHPQSCRLFTVEVLQGTEGKTPGVRDPERRCVEGNRIWFYSDAGFGIYDLTISGERVLPDDLSFVEEPESVSVFPGGETSPTTITLACKFNRNPTTRGWRYRTVEDEAGEMNEKRKLASGKWEQKDNGDLVINDVDRRDAGRYTCFGEDGTASLESSADVEVFYFNRVQRKPFARQAMIGQTVSLTCEIPDSHPKLDVTVYKVGEDGKKVRIFETESRYEFYRMESLLEIAINSVTVEDSGTYHCKLSTRFDTTKYDPMIKNIRSPIGVLTVQGSKPSVMSVSDRVFGNLESTVSFGVKAEGEPTPSVQWFRAEKGGEFEPLDTSSGRMETMYSGPELGLHNLTIQDLSLEDHETQFKVEVSNSLGTVTSEVITLFVNHMVCESRVLKIEETFDEEEPARLVCSEPVSAFPEAGVRWIYNYLTSTLRQNGSVLTTDSLSKGDEGVYSCEYSNIAGQCDSMIDLKIRPIEEEEEELPETEDMDSKKENSDSKEDSEDAPEAVEEETKEKKKKKKSKRCEIPHKKMGRRCLEEKWDEMDCAAEKGADNTGSITCGKWSKQCDKNGNNKHCCKAIFCWGRKLSVDFDMGDEESGEKKEKPEKSCPTQHKHMRKKCLAERWNERSCDDEAKGRSVKEGVRCGDLSKRCDANGRNEQCCMAIYCWGRKLSDTFPEI